MGSASNGAIRGLRLHIRSLSDGTPHPAAYTHHYNGVILVDEDEESLSGIKLQIYASLVAVVYVAEKVTTCASVWDWRTGELLWVSVYK